MLQFHVGDSFKVEMVSRLLLELHAPNLAAAAIEKIEVYSRLKRRARPFNLPHMKSEPFNVFRHWLSDRHARLKASLQRGGWGPYDDVYDVDAKDDTQPVNYTPVSDEDLFNQYVDHFEAPMAAAIRLHHFADTYGITDLRILAITYLRALLQDPVGREWIGADCSALELVFDCSDKLDTPKHNFNIFLTYIL